MRVALFVALLLTMPALAPARAAGSNSSGAAKPATAAATWAAVGDRRVRADLAAAAAGSIARRAAARHGVLVRVAGVVRVSGIGRPALSKVEREVERLESDMKRGTRA